MESMKPLHTLSSNDGQHDGLEPAKMRYEVIEPLDTWDDIASVGSSTSILMEAIERCCLGW